MRSLPAVQWNTAGRASGAARTCSAARICPPASRSISRYCVPRRPGRRSNSSASGSSSMKGKWWKATGWASTSNRPRSSSCPERRSMTVRMPSAAQHREVGLGQLAEPVGPEQRPPARPQAPAGHVAAEVAEVDRAFQGDEPFDGLHHVSAPPSVAVPGGRRVRTCSLHAPGDRSEHLREQQVTRRQATGMSHMGNQRVRSASTGRSAPTMVRMRSSSSVSRRSAFTSTGAKG